MAYETICPHCQGRIALSIVKDKKLLIEAIARVETPPETPPPTAEEVERDELATFLGGDATPRPPAGTVESEGGDDGEN